MIDHCILSNRDILCDDVLIRENALCRWNDYIAVAIISIVNNDLIARHLSGSSSDYDVLSGREKMSYSLLCKSSRFCDNFDL